MTRTLGFRLSDRAFFGCSVAILAVIAAIATVLAAVFLKNIWMVGDTKLFLDIADKILQGKVLYVDMRDPKPPLIFFTLTIPTLLGQQFYGSLALVGLCNILSALVVLGIAWRLYGRLHGFIAGLLFLLNMALAEGFFILTEPFTLLFILLSAYALLFMDRKYLLSGIFAGVAIGFKQYALLLLPLALFYLYRKGELKGALSFCVVALSTLAAIFGVIFLLYGTAAGQASLYWSFGIADMYMTQSYLGDIPAYMAASPLLALANVGLEVSLFVTLLTVALAGVVRDRRLAPSEEFFLLSGAAFLSILVIRQYLHYWALALPFIILLCVRAYRREAPK